MTKIKRKKQLWWFIIIVTILFFLFFYLQKNKISKENAIAKVKSLSKVKNYLQRVPHGLINVSNEEKDSYLIQVYEIKDGHTATFNWYKVNKKTGVVEKEF